MTERYWGGSGNTAVVATLLAGAETALLYLLLAELGGSPRAAPMPWAVLWALALLAFFLPRALHGIPTALYSAAITLGVVSVSLLCIYIFCYPGRGLLSTAWIRDAGNALTGGENTAERNVMLLLFTMGVLWWRQMARETPGSDAAGWLFRWGPVPVAALTVGGVGLWGASSAEVGLMTGYITAFFVLNLLALAYTRWVETPGRSGGRVASLLNWLSASLVPILLAVAITSAVSGLLFGRVAPVLALLGRAVLTVIAWVLTAVVTVVGAVAWVVYMLVWTIIHLLGNTASERPTQPQAADDTQREIQELLARAAVAPGWLMWALVFVLAVLALYGLTRLRPRRESVAGAAVIRESVWAPPDLGLGIRQLLSGIRRRLPGSSPDPLAPLLRDPTWRHTAEVRRAYREVQAMYGRAGRGRATSQTPTEHALTVESPELDELAAIYGQARYGAEPATESTAARAQMLRAALTDQLRDTPIRTEGSRR